MVEDINEKTLDGSLSPFQTAGGFAGGRGSRGDVLTAERDERVDLFLRDEGVEGIGPARQSHHLREGLWGVCMYVCASGVTLLISKQVTTYRKQRNNTILLINRIQRMENNNFNFEKCVFFSGKGRQSLIYKRYDNS